MSENCSKFVAKFKSGFRFFGKRVNFGKKNDKCQYIRRILWPIWQNKFFERAVFHRAISIESPEQPEQTFSWKFLQYKCSKFIAIFYMISLQRATDELKHSPWICTQAFETFSISKSITAFHAQFKNKCQKLENFSCTPLISNMYSCLFLFIHHLIKTLPLKILIYSTCKCLSLKLPQIGFNLWPYCFWGSFQKTITTLANLPKSQFNH